MTSRGSALAVVPAYNECRTVAEVVRSIRKEVPDFDVLVVDDGSTDRTAELAERAGAWVLKLPFNLGIGGAVQAGFAFDPAEIRKLQDVLHTDPHVDMVCGSRFLTSDYRYPAPISRRTGIHLFAYILSRVVGQRVSDPTAGFRMYNRRAIELFARDYPHDYPEVEAVLMVHFHRLRMREVPVRMYARGGGESSITSGKSIYYMIKVLLAITVGLVRARPVPEPGDEAPVTATAGI
jgi:glycosyltransferase involved in cell wall biosynthesis